MNKIQWYPGHMARGIKKIEENIKLANFFIIVLDSRIPLSSFNINLINLIKSRNKKILILLNKSDISDDNETKKWNLYFNTKYDFCLSTNLKNQKEVKKVKRKIVDLVKEFKIAKIIILGIPNVGKSTLINIMANKKLVKEQNTPGITKEINWYKITKNLQILDSPGILLPSYEDEISSFNLAFTNNIKLHILPIENISYNLIEKLKIENIKYLNDFYKTNFLESDETQYILDSIAKKRGILIRGNPDYSTLGFQIIRNFSDGKMGKYTLEKYDEHNLSL